MHGILHELVLLLLLLMVLALHLLHLFSFPLIHRDVLLISETSLHRGESWVRFLQLHVADLAGGWISARLHGLVASSEVPSHLFVGEDRTVFLIARKEGLWRSPLVLGALIQLLRVHG